jgi:hypothetical protein
MLACRQDGLVASTTWHGLLKMALRFISHKEIAFRQLLGMLRTPPMAMMNYYSNLFLSAKFVLMEEPQKVVYLEKEIRRAECKVGVQPTSDSQIILKILDNLYAIERQLETYKHRVESIYETSSEEEQAEVGKAYQEIENQLKEIAKKEHYYLFRLQPLMPLKEIETYNDNFNNLKAFFKEGGKKVTQLELMGDLDKIKVWIYSEAMQIMPMIRFTKLE